MGATESLDQEGFSEQHVGKEQVETLSACMFAPVPFTVHSVRSLKAGFKRHPQERPSTFRLV